MAIGSSILTWRISWTVDPGELQSVGSQKSRIRLSKHTRSYTSSLFPLSITLPSLWSEVKRPRLDNHSCIGEGNGNPLQCSCLENPRDGGAWWAAVSGVAQSRIRLKRLSSSSSSSRQPWERCVST